MNVLEIIKKVPLKKVAGVAIAVVAGIGAIKEAVEGNQIEEELKNLKKEVSELKSNQK